jgi:CheY-like chemotaxis protein/HPt (histidine-containing phosphotransfer) domain-containing protein
MGGGVGVTSQQGKGSEFWFTVRLGRSSGLENQPEATQLVRESSAFPDARILIVEDNATNREVALAILKKLGLRADAVADGAESLIALASIPYDLVLMDMRMPVMDGIEATRHIRDRQSAVLDHDIPIIAMTANAMASDRESCFQAGMNDFVPKPVSKAELRDALRKWLPRGDADNRAVVTQLVTSRDAESEPAVFDSAGMLERLEGDKELAMIVFESFLEDLPHQIEALKGQVECGDSASAARQAHSIRGASSNVGGERLRKVATEMEKAADVGDIETVSNRMAELEEQFSLLRDAIEEAAHAKPQC